MNLTEEEAKKISSLYQLGKVEKIKPINEGLINYNFIFKTNTGEYIVRTRILKMDKYRKYKFRLIFEVLSFLKNKNFPYNTPEPIKNKNNQCLSKIGRKVIWVYPKMPGIITDLNNDKLKQLARSLAVYHECMKEFRFKKDKRTFSLGWLQKRYAKSKKPIIKNKTDRLYYKHLEFFKDTTDKLAKINFNINLLVNHADFHKGNVLFKKGKLVTLLDFDEVKIAPRANDVAYTLKQTCLRGLTLDKSRVSIFIKEYEKLIKLTKSEKAMIPLLILRDNCIVFWWIYNEMEKCPDKKYQMLNWTVKNSKILARESLK